MKTNHEILTQLNELLPDGQWRVILTMLAITGLADGLQLQQAAKMDYKHLGRTLEKMEQATAGEKPLVRMATGILQRANLQGRAPKVYELSESGAAFLRHLGNELAHAGGQTSAIARTHALTILDIHLAAVHANLPVQTEKVIRANERTCIRPDCLVTLSDGQQAIFEAEQLARPDYLPRMSESLQNKLAFFKAGGQASPVIRVLFNLRPGPDLARTLSRWQGLTHLLRKENGGRLPFTLLGMSIVDFLNAPDWSPEPDAARWLDLTQPLTETEPVRVQPSAPALPPFSSKENALLLQAMLQWLKENNTKNPHHQSQFPDPAFFDVMEIIYLASYHPNAPALQRAAFPNESIYLLGQYISSNPDLQDALDQSILRGGSGMLWNASTIMHRMQTVVDTFLAYHGFRSDGALRAIPVTVDWSELRPKSFAVRIDIDTADILPVADNKSSKQRIEAAENALAWVLRALFVHAARIGLKTPRFW